MRNPLTDGAVCGILGGVMEKEEDRRQVSTACRSVYMNVDTGEKTWLTPKYIVDALGPFDLDPCCPDGGMPWTTAKRMVTKSEDGLSVDWTGCRVWMNPPYGRESAPFFEKMSHHVSGGVRNCVRLREDGHSRVARPRVPERTRPPVHSRARQVLPPGWERRGQRADPERAHRVLGLRFGTSPRGV